MGHFHEVCMRRGIDDPGRLQAWLEAKGHRYIVLCVADVLDMPDADRRELAVLCGIDETCGSRLAWQRAGLDGYVCLPIQTLFDRTLEELTAVQGLLWTYRETRIEKFKPSISEPCECVAKGTTRDCKMCEGEGKIHTLIELSDREIALATKGPHA